jgi:hypothetical protein
VCVCVQCHVVLDNTTNTLILSAIQVTARMEDWSEVVSQVVNLRCQVCPRTSYSTTGFAASTLMVAPLVTVGLDRQQQVSPALQAAIINSKEFEHIDQRESMAVVQQSVRGHCVLFTAVPTAVSTAGPDSVRQLVEVLFAENRSKLVMVLTTNDSPLSKAFIQQELAATSSSSSLASPAHYRLTHWTLHAWTAANSRRKRPHDSSSNGSPSNLLHPELGFNEQPAVQSRCQFRYLWSLLPRESSCFARDEQERAAIADAKQRTLYRIANHVLFDGSSRSVADWERSITRILQSGGDDYDVYDAIRICCTNMSIDQSIFQTKHTSSVNTKVNTSSGTGTADEHTNANDEEGFGRNGKLVKDIQKCVPDEYRVSHSFTHFTDSFTSLTHSHFI